MKLLFLGTRGEIEARTKRHGMHAALVVSYGGRRIMIDAGRDWLGRLEAIRPRGIVITHAHPDHAWGLKDGAPCAVYATEASWRALRYYPIADPRTVWPRMPFDMAGIRLEAFTVEHSVRAPAVGYRITAGRVTVFYAPDLVYVHDGRAALAGVRVYIGDGATLVRSFIRRRGDQLIGHAPVRTQLGWCATHGVPRAIITHCGSEIVAGDEARAIERLHEMAEQRGVEAELAYDGMEVLLR